MARWFCVFVGFCLTLYFGSHIGDGLYFSYPPVLNIEAHKAALNFSWKAVIYTGASGFVTFILGIWAHLGNS
ncbi:fibronectin type III domain-containing protein (plasmid) [Desulfovibrio ferrophilus]|uniref:Fibronectin type III domain-containing protein n=1 Tax=Desulfovibrio ferrophilus TaxID=241368 RepID=A0A2Z6B3V5_9BACT|nr:fibronectin type III domain-containing protein [Desulfovibrio ferrophilus]